VYKIFLREVMLLNKNILAIGIVFLFIVSSVTPIVFGYNVRISNEKEIQSTVSYDDGLMDSVWPMKCHDNHHTSQSPYSTADNSYIEKWRFYNDGWIVMVVFLGISLQLILMERRNGNIKLMV
jgi:hypothetical protein